MANVVRRESPSAGKAQGAMGKIVAMSLVAMATFLVHGAWYDDPVVKSTQSSGYENTSVHYINLSEDGKYLMVNLHSSNDAYPVQVYDVAELTEAKGEVLDLTCPEAFASSLTWGTGVNGWKGGAISSALGLMIPGGNGGNGGAKTDGAVFTSLEIPNTTWIANNNAFQLSGLGAGGIDGMDFILPGTRLYGNQYSANRGNIVIFDTATLKTEHAVTLLDTITTPATRIRNLSCYSVGGKDLVYFGEGADGGNGKIYVYDPSVAVGEDNPKAFGVSDISSAAIMNVKLSGTATNEPKMYVLTDDGRLFIYALSADGKTSATLVKSLDNATVNRLCGVSGQTSKFRNFEVTDDGEYAFFIHQSMDGAGGPDLCVVAAAVPESNLNIIGDANAVRTANGQKTVLTYTQSGKMYVAGSGTVEILLVGGGGGGGANHATDGNLGGGGGGGGGVVHKTSFRVTEGVYDVTIGAGGAIGSNGGETTIIGLGVTAYGGGAGGDYYESAKDGALNGHDGASGGGATGYKNSAGAAIYSNQDNLGFAGRAGTHHYGPGGGGGAGAAAPETAGSTPGNGGNGVRIDISGVLLSYGDGGSGYRGGKTTVGGLGGGGYCTSGGGKNQGVDGRGGGGCGGTKGGSGVVIVSFYENEKVCSDDFELIGADETHRIGRDNVLIYNVVTSSGKLTVKGYGAIELLVVGGGGGGGNNADKGAYPSDYANRGGAGGGGGGVLHKRIFYVTPGESSVKVGTGGWQTAGGASWVFSQVAPGGGVGGHYYDTKGYDGGEGGSGGGATAGGTAGRSTATNYGNFGNIGAVAVHHYGAAGGGGARRAAPVCTDSTPGNGGDGVEFAITGTLLSYGDGGSGYRGGKTTVGGKGGGGYCTSGGSTHQGVDGRGGGGCGGAKGGSGVVILRYTRPHKGMIMVVR